MDGWRWMKSLWRTQRTQACSSGRSDTLSDNKRHRKHPHLTDARGATGGEEGGGGGGGGPGGAQPQRVCGLRHGTVFREHRLPSPSK